MSDELPSGWTATTLRELLEEGPTNGYSPESTPAATGTLTLKLSATTSGTLILDHNTTKRIVEQVPTDSKFWLKPGDILVQRANSLEYVGTAALFDGPSNTYIYPDLMMRLRPRDEIVQAAYLWRFINWHEAKKYLHERATGTAGNMPKISGATLRELPVLIPPANEQHRIVAKLDELTSRSRRAKEALDEARDLENKLVNYYTVGWPESVLGEHIQARNELAGEAWHNYATVGLSNDGEITDRRESIGAKTAAKCKVVRFGDIAFNPIRFSIGSIARYYGSRPAIVSPEYQVFRCNSSISPELLVRYLRTPRGRSLLDAQTQGSVRYRVYFRTLEQLRVQLAPPNLQEQAEQILGCLRRVWASLGEVQKSLPRLERAILAKAFRGELVAQDPNDEPASVLLERLRAEREQNGKPTNGTARRRPVVSPSPAQPDNTHPRKRPHASRRSQAPARSRG